MSLGAKLTAASDYLFRHLFKFLFRYDIFISYARRDGKGYALKLRDQLTRLDFSCFLDYDELPAGNSLNKTLRRALRRSAAVVLVGTEGALKSRYVELEVGEFARTGRALIPIDFEGTLASAPWDLIRERDLVWIDETRDALSKSAPSPQVADQIDKLFKYTRRNVRVRAQVIATAALFLLGAAVSVLLIQQQVRAARAANEAAREQQRVANEATARARAEQERAARAVEEARRAQAAAEDALRKADLAEQRADKEGKRAEEQSLIADAKTREAGRAQAAAAVAEGQALEAGRKAEEQARAARLGLSNLLAVRSRATLDGQPRLSLLLAAEAMRATRADDPRVVAAEETLRRALTKAGGRPVGGEGWEARDFWDAPEGVMVEAVALSPDGRWLATASRNRVRLFDLNAADASAPARLIEGAAAPLAFSPDGRWLVAARTAPMRAAGAATPTPTTPAANAAATREHALGLWDVRAPDAGPHTLGGHGAPITTVELSPDGRWLASGGERDADVRLWDLKSPGSAPRVLHVAGEGEGLLRLAFSPDARRLVTSGGGAHAGLAYGDGGQLRLWDLSAADPSAQFSDLKGHGKPVTEIEFSPDGRRVVTASHGCDDGARLWNLNDGQRAAAPAVIKHAGSIGALAFSPDGRWLVTGSGLAQECASDSTARVWDLSDVGAAPYVLTGHEGPIFAATFSPDGRFLVTTVGSGYSTLGGAYTAARGMRTLLNLQGSATAHFWYWGAYAELSAAGELEEARGELQNDLVPRFVLRDPLNSADAFAVSPDRRWLVARSRNNLLVWDLLGNPQGFAMGLPPTVLRGHDGPVSAVAFGADGRRLVTGSYDRSARAWDLAAQANSATPVNRLVEAGEGLKDATGDGLVALSADGRLLVAAADVPGPDTPGPDASEQSHEQFRRRTNSLAYVRRLDEAGLGRALVLRGHAGKIKDAALTPDNRWLVTGSADKTARLWDLSATDPAAGALVFAGHAAAVDDVAVTPDRRWLVTASHDGAARLWDLRAADPTARPAALRNIERRVEDSYQYTNRVHLSPDGRWLVTAGHYYFKAPARLWDLSAADPTARPVELGGIDPDECEFSPDGRWLLLRRTYDYEKRAFRNEALLWDLSRGAAAAPFVLKLGEGKLIHSAAFSADGRWLYTSGHEQSLRRWELTAPDPSAAPATLSAPFADEKQRFVAVAASPDGRRLAAWVNGERPEHRHLLLWDVGDGGVLGPPRALKNPGGYVLSQFAFSPDGRWLFASYPSSGTEVGNLRWSVEESDPEPVQVPGGPLLGGRSVSADGRWLVTRGAAGPELWPLRADELLDLACRAAGRNLTRDEWKEYFPGQEYHATCPELPEGK